MFGGPYSNLQATAALLEWADKAKIPPSHRICTGDVVAYCGDAKATSSMVRKAGIPVVAGNCEQQLASGAEDCGCGFEEGSSCSLMAKDWYAHAKEAVSNDTRDWMGRLPDRLVFWHADKRYVVIHGGAGDVSRFLWPVTREDDFWDEISLLQEEVGAIDAVIAGHCGVPFERSVDGVHWINAGVIGMPANDGISDTWFAVLVKGEVVFHRLSYDAAGAVREMEKAGLVQGYHKSLKSGYWPSEDILPKSMRR